MSQKKVCSTSINAYTSVDSMASVASADNPSSGAGVEGLSGRVDSTAGLPCCGDLTKSRASVDGEASTSVVGPVNCSSSSRPTRGGLGTMWYD